MSRHHLNVDSIDTLFLDRDGIINYKLEIDYVKNWSEFKFKKDFLHSIADLSSFFSRIIVVTNQQGIGKGLMNTDDLNRIHHKMLESIKAMGVLIDAIYYCPHLEANNCNCRKPRTGMALQAKIDFPTIDFKKSVDL